MHGNGEEFIPHLGSYGFDRWWSAYRGMTVHFPCNAWKMKAGCTDMHQMNHTGPSDSSAHPTFWSARMLLLLAPHPAHHCPASQPRLPPLLYTAIKIVQASCGHLSHIYELGGPPPAVVLCSHLRRSRCRFHNSAAHANACARSLPSKIPDSSPSLKSRHRQGACSCLLRSTPASSPAARLQHCCTDPPTHCNATPYMVQHMQTPTPCLLYLHLQLARPADRYPADVMNSPVCILELQILASMHAANASPTLQRLQGTCCP